jgi:hypothetical protein
LLNHLSKIRGELQDGHLATFDEYGTGRSKSAGNAVVLYSPEGKLVKAWSLDILVPKADTPGSTAVHWRDGAKYYFLRKPTRLYITLRWGKVLEFSLGDGSSKYGDPADFPDLAVVAAKSSSDESTEIWSISLRFSSITDVLAAKGSSRP